MPDLLIRHRWITIICLTVSIVLLLTGYIFAGLWQIFVIFPAVLLLLMISKYRPGIFVPSALFGIYMFLASLGILMGLIRYLMVYGSILALATWELQLFQRGSGGRFQHSNLGYLEKHHLGAVSTVVFLSFLLTTIGLNFQLRLPFGMTLLLILLVGFTLKRIYLYLVQEVP